MLICRSALRFCHVTLPVNSCLAIEARARIPFLIAMIQDLSHLTADMGSSLLVRERFGQQRHGRKQKCTVDRGDRMREFSSAF
ncbi:uncharacterized protein F5147DRAFT_698774 [Suillus discolor]|uniref:Uncharacterized protein n=1 Tax=Suillus discolor TaxID=1912936 RepID=A0A9P7JTH2_9AGAM|nr:uncharacterized protein F5147DRAFT_698774 [Suillus discolor]KAG2106944.1 hypothetical protein F5147DRAFT_698774 [Suillus discolor]